MDLNLKSKGVLIAIVAVCSLAMASILTAIPIVKPAYGRTRRDNHNNKDQNGGTAGHQEYLTVEEVSRIIQDQVIHVSSI